MASRRKFVGACVIGAVSAVAGKSAGEETKPVAAQTHSADVSPKRPTPAVKDADAAIQGAMREHWSKPERLLWRIVYQPVEGLSAQSLWHIAGTQWWVRLNPGWVKLDEFDKAKTYEIDAVALDQNYGVIDFYVYEKRVVT